MRCSATRSPGSQTHGDRAGWQWGWRAGGSAPRIELPSGERALEAEVVTAAQQGERTQRPSLDAGRGQDGRTYVMCTSL